MRILLEGRVLFDASLARTVKHVDATHHTDIQHKTTQEVHSLTFIDPRVSGWQTLAKNVFKDGKAIIIDPMKSGISQITDTLKNYTGIKEISIVGYGKPGQIDLGTSLINQDIISKDTTISSWHDHMIDNGGIYLFGCDVGSSSNLVNSLSEKTGEKVYASDKAIGDGDIKLTSTDYTPFTKEGQEAYGALLDSPVASVSFDNVITNASTMPGGTFTKAVNFSNTAINTTGYSPFLEVYSPSSSDIGAKLSSATYLGQNISFKTITLSSNIAGHVGVVGALDPYLKDTKGKSVFVAAPVGYKTGDILYALNLPFGSIAPGQSLSDINLTFKTSSQAVLTSVDGKTSDIAVIGGFAYGSSPISGKDAGIRGTDIASEYTTSDSNGMISSKTDIQVVNVTESNTSVTFKMKTPVGEDYPVSYVTTITAAPATVDNPVKNYQVTMTLPDGVKYDGNGVNFSYDNKGVITDATGVGTAVVDGNKVTITIPSLDSSKGKIVVKVTTSVDSNILANNGNSDKFINAPIVTYTGDNWVQNGVSQAISGNADTSQSGVSVLAFTVDTHQTDINMTGDQINNQQYFPSDKINNNANFHVSQAYAVSASNISLKLSDGQTIDPSSDYVFSFGDTLTFKLDKTTLKSEVVNGQTVYVSGSGNNMSFTRDATTGITTVNFDIASELKSEKGFSDLPKNMSASLLFTTQSLDHYTSTSNSSAITEGDVVNITTTMNGSIKGSDGTVLGNYSANDFSQVTVPQGVVGLTISSVNGKPPVNQTINPDDSVTYNATYALETGTFNGLTMTTYLPANVFNIADPANNGTNLTFTPGSGYTVGEYKLVNAPEGVTIKSMKVDPVTNSIVFDLGSNDGTAIRGENISILFTLKSSDIPNGQNLPIVTQENAVFTDGVGSKTTSASVASTWINKPTVDIKTGIVSVINSDGSIDPSVQYNNEVDGTSNNPSTIYANAGSPNIFVGSPPTSLSEVSDLDASSMHAGQTYRIATTVVAGNENATGDVYDLTVSGVLPSGIDVSNVTNFQIIRSDGTVMNFTKPDGSVATVADFFSNGGIKITNGENPILTGLGGTTGTLSVVYDVKIPSTENIGQAIVTETKVVNYAIFDGGVAKGYGYVVNGTPVTGSETDIDDNATVTFDIPTISRNIGPSNVPEDDAASSVAEVPGSIRTVTITAKIPSGTITNNGNDVTVTEDIGDGNKYVVGSGKIVTSTGIVIEASNVTLSGNVLTFDMGKSIYNSLADSPNQIQFIYQTYRDDVGQSGDANTFTASLQYDGKDLGTYSQTLFRRDPSVDLSVSNDSQSTYYSGMPITYTLKVSNSSQFVSFNTTLTLNGLPDLENVTYYDENGNQVATLPSNIGTLLSGASKTYTIKGNIKSDAQHDSQFGVNSAVTWTSVPSGDGMANYKQETSDLHNTQNLQTGLQITKVESNGNAVQTQTANATIGDTVTMRGTMIVPSGDNPGVNFDINYDGSKVSIDTSNMKILLISADGSVKSSTLDTNGNTADLQKQNDGTVNPYAIDISHLVPASLITTTDGKITINLGDLASNYVKNADGYVVVEFNEKVLNNSNNVNDSSNGTYITSESGTAKWASSPANVSIVEPQVTFTKKIVNINQETGEITFKDTITNTGSITAYNTTLQDLIASNNESSAYNITATNGYTATSDATGVKSNFNLEAGKTVELTYTVKAIDKSLAIPVSTATVQFASLSGASGGADEARDGSGALATDTYKISVNVGFGAVNGQVWQALGRTPETFNGTYDTPLKNASVSITSDANLFENGSNNTQTIQSDANGNWSIGLIPDGTYSLNINNIPSGETIVYNSNGGALPTSMVSNSDTKTLDLAYELANSAPVINGTGIGGDVNSGSTVDVFSNISLSDAEIDKLVSSGNWTEGYGGSVLHIAGYDANNQVISSEASHLTFDTSSGNISLNNQDILYNGNKVASYAINNGVMDITFVSGTTKDAIVNVADALAYKTDSNNNELVITKHVRLSFSDGNANDVSGGITGVQGTGGAQTSNYIETSFSVIPYKNIVNDYSYQKPNNEDHATTAVKVLPDLIIDASGKTITSATVKITNFIAEDNLSFTSVNGIQGAYDKTTGILTLTGSASQGDYQTVLNSVAYYDNSETPYVNRQPLIVASVVADSTTYDFNASRITILNANNSPILDTSVNVSLADTTEFDGTTATTPVGSVGTQIASLVSLSNNVKDTDGSSVVNGNVVSNEIGMVITDVDTNHGVWWYSTDNGTNWNLFASKQNPMTTPLRLSNDTNNRIVFVPTDVNWNGKLDNALSFRAWNVGEGGSTYPSSGYGTGINTDGSAYSSAVKTISETVIAQNNAPVFTQTDYTYVEQEQDSNLTPDRSVNAIFSGLFSDAADQQQSTSNPDGSVANSMSGIVVTDYAPSNGVKMQYKDNSGNWQDVPTVTSLSSAFVIGKDVDIRFVGPTIYYNGTPNLSATVFAIDSSTSSVGTMTGDYVFNNGNTVWNNVDITNRGGHTAVSENPLILKTQILAVNNAPDISGDATIKQTNEYVATISNTDNETLVSDIVSQSSLGYTDAKDQQYDSTLNTNGSKADPASAIAIVGNSVSSTFGTWEYKDSNSNWVNIDNSVSDKNAIILGTGVSIRFVPVNGYNGQVSLTFRALDDASITTTSVSTGVDVSNNGGNTHVSSETANLISVIYPVANAPTGPSVVDLGVQDQGVISNGISVYDAYSAGFSDSIDDQNSTLNPKGSTSTSMIGIIVVGNQESQNGAWQYEVGGSTNWTTIPNNVSDQNGIFLLDNVKIRFLANQDYNGIPSPLTVRYVAGEPNTTPIGIPYHITAPIGTLPDGNMTYISTQTPVLTNISISESDLASGITLVSAKTTDTTIAVKHINHAPDISGSFDMNSIQETHNNGTNNGNLVSDIINSSSIKFDDSKDNQYNPTTNPNGSKSDSFVAIAITGVNVPANSGQFQYKDANSNWNTIDISNLSDTNAVVIGANVAVRFLPSNNFNGQVSFSFHAVESSDTSVDNAGTIKGSMFVTNPALTYTGVNISNEVGGSGPVSSESVTSKLTVESVNNAPTTNASSVTVGLDIENEANIPTTTVGGIWGTTFLDTDDNQKTSDNPTGSVTSKFAGVIITGNTVSDSFGKWSYQDASGWHDITKDISETNGLYLSSDTALRFVSNPNYNGTATGLTARLVSDGSSGINTYPSELSGIFTNNSNVAIKGVDVTKNNGSTDSTSIVSASEIATNAYVSPVNNAPVVSGNIDIYNQNETHSDTNAGSPFSVADIIAGINFSDSADQQKSATNPDGSVANVANAIVITSNPFLASEGVLQYKDNSGNWVDINNDLSDSNGLVLGTSIQLRFVANKNYNGNKDITFRVVENSSGEFNKTTGNSLTSSSIINNVDVTNNGGTTAISAGTAIMNVNVEAVENAPLSPTEITFDTQEDNAIGGTVQQIFGAIYRDNADNQKSDANPNGSIASTFNGIVITGNNTTTEGKFEYEDTTGWHTISNTLSDTNALYLNKDTNIRFVPALNYNGDVPSLNIHVVSQTTHQHDLNNTNTPAISAIVSGNNAVNLDVSSAINDDTSIISNVTMHTIISVINVNDAPTVVKNTESDTYDEGSNATGVTNYKTVADVFGNAFSDSADQQKSATNPDGSTANNFAGVIITNYTENAQVGTWVYSTDGKTMNVIGNITGTDGLALTKDTLIAFIPGNENFNGMSTSLNAHLYEDGQGTLNGKLTSGDITSPQTITNVITGNDSAVSTDVVNYTVVIKAENNAPVATGSQADMLNGIEDQTTNSQKIYDIFNPLFSDQKDAQRTSDNPTGSVASLLNGVAIIANDTPASEGVWQYEDSTDWHDIGNVSNTKALILGNDISIRFVPAKDFNGNPSPLQARLIETSSDLVIPSDNVSYSDVSNNGGSTHISSGIVDYNVAIKAVNNNPEAFGSIILPDIQEDGNTTPITVSDLFSKDLNDSADAQQSNTNPNGSIANTLSSVAIVANNTPASEGSWRYEDASGWHDIGNVSDTNALILGNNIRIMFAPAKDFNGRPSPLSVKLIENSVGSVTSNLSGQDVTADTVLRASLLGGETSALTDNVVNVFVSVSPINNAPILDGKDTNLIMKEGDNQGDNIKSEKVSDLVSSYFSDTADQQQNASNETGSVSNDFGGILITNAEIHSDLGHWVYSENNQNWTAFPELKNGETFVLSKDASIAFIPATEYFNGSAPKFTVHLYELSNGSIGDKTGNTVKTGDIITGVTFGGDTAGSVNTVAIGANIISVDNSPELTQKEGNVSVEENSTNSWSVKELFSNAYTDVKDQQKTSDNPSGSIATPFGGVVIVGNNTPDAVGYWTFTSKGVTYNLPKDLTQKEALVVGSDVVLTFIPGKDYNGKIPNLDVKMVSDAIINPDSVMAWNTLVNSTAMGKDVYRLNVSVEAVNQKPTTDTSEIDYTADYGNTVTIPSNVVESGYNDSRNQQYSLDNPFGSKSGPVGGVVITGITNTDAGTWSYTLNGHTFTLPTNVSDKNAVVIPGDAKLTFTPNDGFSGKSTLTVSTLSAGDGYVGMVKGSDIFSFGAPLTNVDVSHSNAVSNSRVLSVTIKAQVIPPLPPQPTPEKRGYRPILSDSTLRNGLSRDALNAYNYPYGYKSVVTSQQTMFSGSHLNDMVHSGKINTFIIPTSSVTGGQGELTYEARLETGESLPTWMTFDSHTQTFTMTPPEGTENINIMVAVTDQSGGKAYIPISFNVNDSALVLDDLMSRITRDVKILGQDNGKHATTRETFMHKVWKVSKKWKKRA